MSMFYFFTLPETFVAPPKKSRSLAFVKIRKLSWSVLALCVLIIIALVDEKQKLLLIIIFFVYIFILLLCGA